MNGGVLRKGFWAHWTWMHWLLLVLVTVLSVKKVYDNQVQRVRGLETDQVEVIEENIQEFNTMAERLNQLEVLPPVKNQWQYIPAIATRYGVELKVLKNDGEGNRMYDGPLAAWNGEITGKVGSVLVAALEIQKTVPAFLYQIQIKDGKAQLGFSIIGSE
ncbi:hypothetical protein FT643_02080 [Ketobacter sp. MCCC 1A13808]|uniref:hypothetical protein n=1 Tax=Ketobacter sp. MCCC 1A13808 TaxID=2602738 RepID=UPI000F1AE5F7|nr:hypothetical protein [Ketobacter sp. MCCC 1A13808]MVF10920.1 hypothetical protein [Ketobacter sp. MCCC 1A13808]RLP56312.1 MAG: hypothetical protein D6160_02675 [Ketobacter sp.]